MMEASDVIKSESGVVKGGIPFICTATEGLFPYEGFGVHHIYIEDIAKSLSQLCRFTGHTSLFYSVAQHSLLVSEKMPTSAEGKLVGLLHDAAEAYTNDLPSPLKAYLLSRDNTAYRDLQAAITATIYERFGIEKIPGDVKLYDTAAAVFEAEGFLGLNEKWLGRYAFLVHLRGLWEPWDPIEYAGTCGDQEPGDVETLFLRRFEELMAASGREGLM
jgi:hypothetical protein